MFASLNYLSTDFEFFNYKHLLLIAAFSEGTCITKSILLLFIGHDCLVSDVSHQTFTPNFSISFVWAFPFFRTLCLTHQSDEVPWITASEGIAQDEGDEHHCKDDEGA